MITKQTLFDACRFFFLDPESLDPESFFVCFPKAVPHPHMINPSRMQTKSDAIKPAVDCRIKSGNGVTIYS
jgi:hypothetical protein